MKREELSALSNTQLRARAKLAGASPPQMEEAAYAGDVKEALILLLLDLELPACGGGRAEIMNGTFAYEGARGDQVALAAGAKTVLTRPGIFH
jgi:hypothetical protein